MKTIISIVIVIIVALFLLEVKITFHPFKISVNGWPYLLAWCLIVAAVIIFSWKSYEAGEKDTYDKVNSILKEKLEEQKHKKDSNKVL